MTQRYGPVGSLVFCSYWRMVHRVLSHNPDGSVTVQGVEHPFNSPQWKGDAHMLRVRTHATPMDKRDRIVTEAIS